MEETPEQLTLPLFESDPVGEPLPERQEEKGTAPPRSRVGPDRPDRPVLEEDATDEAGVSVVMTASEIAERIGFSPDWVLDRFEAGDVPGYRFGRKGGPVRFRWADWELFLRRCRVGPSVEVVQTHGA